MIESDRSTAVASPTGAPAAHRRPRQPGQAKQAGADRRTDPPRQDGQDWSNWPVYDAATLGFRNYWYPVLWSTQVTSTPRAVTVLGEHIMIMRDAGNVYALHDRCPHRGVPLSEGCQQFPGTVSCPYHGWTYDLNDGRLCAVITDGPDSPVNGRVRVATYPAVERLGLVFIWIGDEQPHLVEDDIPEELTGRGLALGGHVGIRTGNWRFAAENGFDEGHAKYLHRTSLWRLFKTMSVWNKTHIEEHGPWLIRVQDEQHWDVDFPGIGHFTNRRWWKHAELPDAPGRSNRVSTGIAALKLPGYVSIRMPGLLRVAFPRFIHYEWYVPVDADHVRYVQIAVALDEGLTAWTYIAKYLTAFRWLFHGQFTKQDKWMVDVTDAPPEKLYRPDLSITAWRKRVEDTKPIVQPAIVGRNGTRG